MPDKKISQLVSAEATLSGVVPVSDAGGTTTNKVTIQSILNAETRWNLFLPPAPSNLTATGGNAQASLSWSAPTVLAQTPITDYLVQFSSDSGSSWTTFSDGTSTSTTATVTGLTNGTAYVFRVAAVNGVGTGAYTAASSAVTPVLLPAPTGLTATAGNAQVSLSWTAPSGSYTPPITDYVVQFSTNSGSSWTTFSDGTSTATSATVTGLTNGTAYVFRVAAVNGVGTGAYTAASASVTPSAGTTATLTSGGGANSWRWNAEAGYSDSLIFFGRWDDNTVSQAGWRTTFTPASKPTTISSAVFTLPYGWSSNARTDFSAVLRGAKLANAGQGIQGTSPTTASATGSVSAAASTGTLTIDCTAVIAEIIGQSGWNPGNSIVLYLSGENAAFDREISGNPNDTAGSLVITYA